MSESMEVTVDNNLVKFLSNLLNEAVADGGEHWHNPPSYAAIGAYWLTMGARFGHVITELPLIVATSDHGEIVVDVLMGDPQRQHTFRFSKTGEVRHFYPKDEQPPAE